MRKIKNIAVVTALVLVVIMVFAGCSCSNNSDNPNNQNNSTEQNSVNNQTANNSNTKSNTDFEPTVSLEQRKGVNPESYINGKDFDINSYAEALGYTKLDDPKGCVIYAIKRGETKCFVYITQQVIFAMFDQNDGYTYQADPLTVTMSENAYLIDNKAKEEQQKADDKGLRRIANIMSFIATTDSIDYSHLSEFESVFKLSGSPTYSSNGAPKETSMNVVETIDVKH